MAARAPAARAPTRSRPAARFDLDAPVTATPPASQAPPQRLAARPRPAPARERSRASGVSVASLAAPAARAPDAPQTAPAPRVARAAPEKARAGRASGDSQRLASVPLAALAACVSDREEDDLKLQVVSRVGGARECVSEAGRYRFVETKNLNAFLMSIERAPSRKQTDRCIELRLALECLASGARHGAQRARGERS